MWALFDKLQDEGEELLSCGVSARPPSLCPHLRKLVENSSGTTVCDDCGLVLSENLIVNSSTHSGGNINKHLLHARQMVNHGGKRKYYFSEIILQWRGGEPDIPAEDLRIIHSVLRRIERDPAKVSNATVIKALSMITKDPAHAVEGTRWARTKKFKRRSFGYYRERMMTIRSTYDDRGPEFYCAGPSPPSHELLEVCSVKYQGMVRGFPHTRHTKACDDFKAGLGGGARSLKCHKTHKCRAKFPSRQAIRYALNSVSKDPSFRGSLRAEAVAQMASYPALRIKSKRRAVEKLLRVPEEEV